MARSAIKLNPLHGTFGLPPSTYVSNSMMVNSMPVMEITPARPHFSEGMTVFELSDDWETYEKILRNHGFTLPGTPIKFAFVADNFPTDAFTNEYGESFLQKFTDVASQGMQQIVQMTGADEFTGGLQNLGEFLSEMGTDEGVLQSILGAAGKGAIGTAEALRSVKERMSGNAILSGAAETLDSLMGGHRIDFPMIWRNSGFTPSYTVTLRLYNPNPGSEVSTRNHIVGPLAVLMCLAIPRSKNGKSFNWPFFHRIKAPGIYNLDPAIITNMTVIKGGDQQQIAFNQRMGMVDVRMDFTSLFGTMILEEEGTFAIKRPTVQGYLDSLTPKSDNFKEISTRKRMREDGRYLAGAGNLGEPILIASNRTTAQTIGPQIIANNRNAAARRLPQTVEDDSLVGRIPITLASRQRTLELETPVGLIV